MDAIALQRSWDAMQDACILDREDRFAAMLDAVEAAAGAAPRVLDLGGGTGSITLRLLRRLPDSRAVVLDADPVLLAIAEATFADDDRVGIAHADLVDPRWVEAVPEAWCPFDAVVTATALHWLPSARIAAVYAEAADLLRSGGVVANVDHMPDSGLVNLAPLVEGIAAKRAVPAAGALDWDGWWKSLEAIPDLADSLAARGKPPHHMHSVESSDWHVRALRAAGCTEVGLVWRGHQDALIVGVRS
jgi:trans-aconitate methyltransferase